MKNKRWSVREADIGGNGCVMDGARGSVVYVFVCVFVCESARRRHNGTEVKDGRG